MNLLILLISEIAFCCVAIIKKQWRNAGISSYAIWAAFIYLVPILIFTATIISLIAEIQLSIAYFGYLFSWVVAFFTHNFIRIYLYRFQSLSEFLAFDFIFATLILYVIDISHFSYNFSPYSLLGVLAVLTGSVILHSQKNTKTLKIPIKKIPFMNLAGMFVLISLLTAFSLTMSKAAVSLQNPFFHGAIANALLFLCYFLIGRKKLNIAISSKSFKKKTLYLCCFAMLIGSLAEAWALKTLPLTIIALTGLFIPLTIYSSYDFFNREILSNKQSTVAIILIFTGFALYITNTNF